MNRILLPSTAPRETGFAGSPAGLPTSLPPPHLDAGAACLRPVVVVGCSSRSPDRPGVRSAQTGSDRGGGVPESESPATGAGAG
ncbi:hypothetical protein [Rhodococcus koreensis]